MPLFRADRPRGFRTGYLGVFLSNLLTRFTSIVKVVIKRGEHVVNSVPESMACGLLLVKVITHQAEVEAHESITTDFTFKFAHCRTRRP